MATLPDLLKEMVGMQGSDLHLSIGSPPQTRVHGELERMLTHAELTPTEFRLVYALALERGRVLTRDELLQRVWGRRATHRDRTVDVFVRKLREKIDQRTTRHSFIQTRYGVGYKLDPLRK